MESRFEVRASGLAFPEGPVILPDGGIVVTQLMSGQVTLVKADGSRQDVHAGGSPNGTTLGSDGALYVTQHGGLDPWVADKATPGIQRVDFTNGTVEDLVIDTGDLELIAPNDLCFGPDGRLYFTDPGVGFDLEGRHGTSRVWAVGPSMVAELVIDPGPAYHNGIGFLPDGRLIWVESYDRNVVVVEDGQPRVIAQLAEGHIPDGFAISADGRIFIATALSCCVDVVTFDGEILAPIELGPEAHATNCAFDGSTLWITDIGPYEAFTDGSAAGRLIGTRTDAVGAPVLLGALP